MSTGKKIGILAFICAIILVIFSIIQITQKPEIRDEVYDILYTDMELADEMYAEDMENASTLFKIADKATTYSALVGVILAIVSLVKMIKGNEKGKIIPILSIVIIIIFYIILMLFGTGMDMGKVVQSAGNSITMQE